MRDQFQALFDTDDYAAKVPLARSTWSDALANPQRSEILRETVQVLVRDARNELPDRFAGIQRVRGTAEWHLLKLLRVAVLKDFFACLRPRFHQSWIGFWPFFYSSWFDPAGTVANSLFGDQHQ
jgi:hypothetical protein